MQTHCKSPAIDQAKIIQTLEALPDIERRGFTSFEIGIIRKYVPTKGIPAVAKILGKPVSMVTNKWYKVKSGYVSRS